MARFKNKRPKTTILFYIVVFYVFASYLWWSYLLSEKNEHAFQYHIEMERLKYNAENDLQYTDTSYLQTTAYQDLRELYERQKWMIRGEGTVFLILLAIGAWSVQRFLNKEIALAMQQNNFLLSITHELKSPLASIKLSLQTFLRRVPMEERFERLTNNSIRDVDRLEALVDNILFAAKMERGAYAYELEATDLSALLQRLVQDYALQKGANFNWKTEIEPDVDADIDSVPFTSVIMNVLENAMKYAPAESEITVKLSKGKQIQLQVIDQGTGIAPDEREKVFEKFYRIGNEETRNTKGTGLGLYIVHSVVKEHGGSIKISDAKPQGTIFTILLPLPKD